MHPARYYARSIVSDAAPAAGAAAEKKRPLLRRVPTPLLVTLLGIGLSAWLLPAFSRQWDDRQKAQQLKVAIVSDMASATARALIGGEALWDARRPCDRARAACERRNRATRKIDKTKVLDAWGVESLALETRLRAYFGSTIVSLWEIYSWFVDTYDGAHRGQAEQALIDATTEPIHLAPGASDAIAQALYVSDRMVPWGPHFAASPRLLFEQKAFRRLRVYVKPHMQHAKSAPGFVPYVTIFGPNVAEFELLRIQAEMAREISTAHAAGYSTNAQDLLHDLIP
jgi:hypothetical protein